MELEDALHTSLGRAYVQWPSNAQEYIAWQNVNRMSAQFLYAPPDAAGFILDDEYKEIFTIYLGLPSPACALFIGQWIGSEGKQCNIDEH
eukprot:4827990-Ditylum_brightwellii.AAC.1